MNKIVASLLVLSGIWAVSCATKTGDVSHPFVSDEIHLLTDSQRDSLTTVMKELESTVGSQMAVVIIASLNGRNIDEYSRELANTWGLGRRDYNDGVLITVALQDRQMRIEVGKGLERIITDEIAAQILKEDMVPAFRQEKYFEGIYVAATRMRVLIAKNKPLIGHQGS